MLPNRHLVKEHWGQGMFLTNKLYQIYELGDRLLKGKFLLMHAQLYKIFPMTDRKISKRTGLGPGLFLISPLRSIIRVYNQI